MSLVFIHLHTHSNYSFLEGVPSPTQLAQVAAQHDMPALALTDHYHLTGAIEFYDACHSASVKPILGLELDVSAPPDLQEGVVGPLVLLAMDLSGWSSMCRLSSALLTRPELTSTSSIPFDLLAENATGLICLSGGQRSLAAQWARENQDDTALGFFSRLGELFPDRLYAEIQRHDPAGETASRRLAAIARRIGLPLVATNPVHYLSTDQAEIQRTLTAMRLNCQLNDLPGEAPAPPGAVFTSGEEMAIRFADLPEAIAATAEIAERCQLELPLGAPHYPEIPLLEGMSAIQTLRERAYQGARGLYGELSLPISERLDHELDVIDRSGYAVLFLIMEGIIRFANRADIPSASRGSASSSLVAHCLGITTPDPLRLNLYFERFLNPARHKPPDIDTDLCSRRRDEVIQHVYETYGTDQVAMVCTINRFRARSALREVAKAYGLQLAEIDQLVAALPGRGWGPPWRWAESARSPYAELAQRYNTTLHRAVFRIAAEILGAPHHLSIHPGGMVISPGSLTDLVPTQLATKGVIITQFDLDSIERVGLVKIDLLGIRGLTVLGDVADALRKRGSGPHPTRLQVLDSIPEEDQATAQLVRTGGTIGCFQIESSGMRTTLKEIQAESPDDVMVALALYRPGPLTGGLKDAFVHRHLGREPVSHLHPALEPLLADTHGVILYQEQVLRIAHELAGLSLAEGDLLRRAMSHFDPGKQMGTLKEKFIAGAIERFNVPEETSVQVWELMAAFAGYGFPKAHAASYAQIAWRSAWCKAHYPAEFMAAVLANWGGYYRQRVYLAEVRRLGLKLRPPHVNFSQREFNLVYLDGEPILFMGLDQVRDLTSRTQHRIMDGRPFSSLADFLARADPRSEEAIHLIKVGALRGMGTIPALLDSLEAGTWQQGQMALFSEAPGEAEDWSLPERIAAQEAILGVGVDAHRLELVTDQLNAAGVLSSLDAASQIGHRVRAAGLRQSWRRTFDRQGGYTYLMEMDDLEGFIEVVISSDVYRRYKPAIRSTGPYVVEGIVELDEATNESRLRAERVWLLE